MAVGTAEVVQGAFVAGTAANNMSDDSPSLVQRLGALRPTIFRTDLTGSSRVRQACTTRTICCPNFQGIR